MKRLTKFDFQTTDLLPGEESAAERNRRISQGEVRNKQERAKYEHLKRRQWEAAWLYGFNKRGRGGSR